MNHYLKGLNTVEEKSRLYIIRRVFILGGLAAFAPLSIDMYLPGLPSLASDLNISTSIAQLSLTACLIGIALGQLVAGPISDALGRRGPLLLGLFLYVIASLFCMFATNIWSLVILRLIQGLAGAAGVVISRAVVRDLYSGSEMTRCFSMLMLINGVAPIIAPILGGQILHVTSWRGVFLVLSVLGVCMSITVFNGLPETLAPASRSRGGINQILCTFGQLIKNKVFMGYALAQGFVMAAMFAYISGSPFVLQNVFGASPQTFSLLFALNGLGLIIASQITGRLAGRIHETKLLAIGLKIAFTGGISLLIIILVGGGILGILLPLFLVVSSVGVVSTSSFSLAMRGQEKSAGSAAALIGVLSFIIGGVIAPFVGIAGNHTALPMGICIASAETAAILCNLILVKNASKEQDLSILNT